MTTEWKDLLTMQDVACAQADGWEIQFFTSNVWCSWNMNVWFDTTPFRGRSIKPKMKNVKMLCYLDTVINQLIWSSSDPISGWIRVPSEDKEIEVPDDN